jgi:hypothetical protein
MNITLIVMMLVKFTLSRMKPLKKLLIPSLIQKTEISSNIFFKTLVKVKKSERERERGKRERFIISLFGPRLMGPCMI